MMPVFFFKYVKKKKKNKTNIKLNFQNNGLNTTNLTDKLCKIEKAKINCNVLYFDLLTRPKMPFQGDAPEGGNTF